MRTYHCKQVVGVDLLNATLNAAEREGFHLVNVVFAGVITRQHTLTGEEASAPSFLIVAYQDEVVLVSRN